jgi:hypothetical protein
MVHDALPNETSNITFLFWSNPAITLSLSVTMATFTQKIFIYLENHIENSRLYHCHYHLKNIYTAIAALKN